MKNSSSPFSLQELADLCKYNVSVEIETTREMNPEFNLEDFLSDLLAFEKYVSKDDHLKYEESKNKIFDLIISNTSYNYDDSYLKHAVFINTVALNCNPRFYTRYLG